MSGLEDIPLIGDVAGVAIHGAQAIGDAVTGDWDGAANQAQSMAGSAIGVATGGISTAAEDVYDAAAPTFGLPDSHQVGHDVLQGVGNAIGDGVYDLVHGGDPDPLAGLNTGDLGLGGASTDGGLGDGGLPTGGMDPSDGGGSPDLGGGDGGYDPSMDGGDMSGDGGDGSY